MTLPLSPAAPLTPPPTVGSAVEFPLGWLLEHAAPPIQYRAIAHVACLPVDPNGPVAKLPYAYRPALLLALTQSPDGSWNRSMLGVPSARAEHFEGVGTINAVRRLLEYGWDRESPPLYQARRLLFRLLAEDEDPQYLFELAPKGQGSPDLARRGRAILREAAAAALAHAGYEGDPRLRGAARRITDRICQFLKSPLGQKPWIRVGNRHVLDPEASPPSIYALTMLAYMPLFRSEVSDAIERIYAHLSQPLPRMEAVQLCGETIVEQPHLVLGDLLPHRNALDADIPSALAWLELMARLGFLRRNDSWCRLFDRMLDDRDRGGVWHPHKGAAVPRSSSPVAWPIFPLESGTAGEEKWTDVTFRLGLIARLSGRPITVI